MTTAQDFARWEQQGHGMTVAQLTYAISDCCNVSATLEAAQVCGGYYRDQACTFRTELRKRQAAL